VAQLTASFRPDACSGNSQRSVIDNGSSHARQWPTARRGSNARDVSDNATRGALGDERGVVYVEFLIAFFPIFLMFLAICQFALLAAADSVVQHAAFLAARSAITVLEDKPSRFDNAPRGDLLKGDPKKVEGLDEMLKVVGIGTSTSFKDVASLRRAATHSSNMTLDDFQPGARMVPVRSAAYMALVPLAPSEGVAAPNSDSVARALVSPAGAQLDYALRYTKASATITLHDDPSETSPVIGSFAADAPITARVTYAYHCTVPVVRAMMCSTLTSIAMRNPLLRRAQLSLPGLVNSSAHFKALSGMATLPNQGAGYYPRDKD
jgi:hypothetical protein